MTGADRDGTLKDWSTQPRESPGVRNTATGKGNHDFLKPAIAAKQSQQDSFPYATHLALGISRGP